MKASSRRRTRLPDNEFRQAGIQVARRADGAADPSRRRPARPDRRPADGDGPRRPTPPAARRRRPPARCRSDRVRSAGPASAAARSIASRPARASSGVRKLPSQPSASVPIRRNAAGAEPPSQMSSGGLGRGATAAAVTVKIAAAVARRLVDQCCTQHPQRLVEHRRALAVGNREHVALAGMAERRPKTGSTRLGATAASEASCLATNTGCRPGSTATDVPTFNRAVRARAYAMPTTGSTAGE